MLGPRQDRLSWQDSFMLMAIVASWRSPDPNTQVGSVIVSPNNVVVSTGYNGFPRGIMTSSLPWDRGKENPLENKYAYVVHAEKNAIANAMGSLADHTLYATMYPCNECAKDIIQAGIRHVIYLDDPYRDTWSHQAAQKMFEQVDLVTTRHRWERPAVMSPLLGDLCKSVEQK